MKWLIVFSLLFASVGFAQTADEVRRIMNPNSSFYDILGVSKNATDDEIKTAYRKLLKVYHPDRYQQDPVKSKAATEVLKKVNIARDTLADPMARRQYDVKIKATTATTTATSAKSAASEGPKKWTPEDFSAKQAKEAAEKAEQAAKEKAAAAAKARAEAAAKDQAEKAAHEAKAAQARAEEAARVAKANAEAAKAAEAKPVYEKPKTPPASSAASTAEKTATYTEKTVFSADGISAKAKEAVKFYQETSRCGEGFFKRFVDVML
ncbi:J domain-containing protein [Bdellovibrio sp. NC01]|uniref:J domain-containing protein n=1 Tax=Bdellovibrio sp. NC01 TaxID=2220073 RepID=UPI00115BF186|nr:J domain-containing protein [Bdellovibrio sp. NC01]QDK38064.1 J domain-containing protein [Bdellovibrio sp. NC01]